MLPSTPGLGLPCEHHYLLASKSGYALGPIDTIQEDHSLMQLAGTLKIPLIKILKYQQCPCFVFLEASVTGAPDLSHCSEPKAPERGWRGGGQALVALHGLMQETHIWCAAMPLPLNTILVPCWSISKCYFLQSALFFLFCFRAIQTKEFIPAVRQWACAVAHRNSHRYLQTGKHTKRHILISCF